MSSVSQISIRLKGRAVPGTHDRQHRIPGFDQQALSGAHVLCVGAGGLMSNIAPTLVRKGVGRMSVFDDDEVEPSNLNRQRFYPKDIGKNKAFALVENLQPECTYPTELHGFALRIEAAIGRQLDLSCDVVVCGVDNNLARITVSRYFREKGIPVVFTAVSADGDHGYVFVQEPEGPCLGCLFPDSVDDEWHPCPGTPAVADILQVVGALAVYAIDTCLMGRQRSWNYRRIMLANGCLDSVQTIPSRVGCLICSHDYDRLTSDKEHTPRLEIAN